MKILIVKLSSIGDVIHALPVLAAIHRELPDAEISWVVEKKAADILRGNEYLTNLIEVDTRALRQGILKKGILPDARRQLQGLRQHKFDVAIDLQGLLKSAALIRLARARRSYGFARESLREPASRFLYTETFAVEPKLHIVEKNLRLAEKALNVPLTTAAYEFPIFSGDAERHEANAIAERAGAKFAILNPAGGWVTKLWSAEKYGQLADKLWDEHGLFSIVTAAPNEGELVERVLKSSKSGKMISSAPSLKGFYELAKKASVYVGGDTGPTFLAVAAKTPVVGIFGPTEWWRNGSPNVDDICVGRDDIACRIDCHRRTCSNWICMDITVETVLQAVSERLKRSEVMIG